MYFNNKILTVLILFIFALLLVYVAYNYQNRYCKGLQINIQNEHIGQFINPKQVENNITKFLRHPPKGQSLSNFNFASLEQFLQKIVYVNSVEVHTNNAGFLCIDITQRQPIARIINKNNNSYYIDNKGYKMALTQNHTARVPIFMGNIIDSNKDKKNPTKTFQDILVFANYISINPFWKAQIETIYIDKNDNVHFFTILGEQKILLGKIDELLSQKLDNLLIFYKEGLPYKGWNLYKDINITYVNQVIGSK